MRKVGDESEGAGSGRVCAQATTAIRPMLIARPTGRGLSVTLFFLALLSVGVALYRTYGMSWDEVLQRAYGEVVYARLVLGDERGLTQGDARFYGPVVELTFFAAERALGLTDPRTIYLTRHLLTFATFCLGVWALFRVAEAHFQSWRMGLLAAALLVLSPRLFADAFYNSKDIPFLSLFSLSIYTARRYLDRQSYLAALGHALVCALLIDTRIPGILVPCFTYAFLALAVIEARATSRPWRRLVGTGLAYTAALLALTTLFWPTLWPSPVASFASAFAHMNNSPWPGFVRYFGSEISGRKLPWHYIPVWMVITTPPLYLALSIIGLASAFAGLRTRPLFPMTRERRDVLLFLTWLFVPVLVVIVLRSTLYDGWRHLFFVYPALLLFSLCGLRALLDWAQADRSRLVRRGTVALLVLAGTAQALAVMSFMVRAHPYQNLYFNALIGGIRGAEGKFELDYWGLSIREAFEYILARDPRLTLRIAVSNRAGLRTVEILRRAHRERISVFVEKSIEDADYFISHNRRGPPPSPQAEWHAIHVDGVKVLSVFSAPRK